MISRGTSIISTSISTILVRSTVGGCCIRGTRGILHTILLRVCVLLTCSLSITIVHSAIGIGVGSCRHGRGSNVVRAIAWPSSLHGRFVLLVLLKVDVFLFIAETGASLQDLEDNEADDGDTN